MKKQKVNASVTAIIGGTSLMNSGLFSSWKTRQIKTACGALQYKTDGESVFLQRHGKSSVPPHKINHRANIRAMKDLGAEKIIAICFVL